MAATNPPFEIEFILGDGVTIPIRLAESVVQASHDAGVRAAMRPGDREGLRRGAIEILYDAISRSENRPLTVDDGETAWLIPPHAIRAIRFRDPTAGAGEQRLGFRPDRYAAPEGRS